MIVISVVSFVGIRSIHRYSPGIRDMEQARRKISGKYHYQRCANEICKVLNAGNIAAVNRVFGALDNDDRIEDILCAC